LVGALVVARTIRRLLYNVAPFDGLTLAEVVGLLALVALAAAAAPAWRAARIDPNSSLRAD
jgi:ABC-type lipoprotein release transport system permease subunit